eukprot:GHVR01026706.1.p1 GENE.GHVR01026706.1~~GHVR01026706.1.p1  ORF type:complete len:432 (+),score=43.79 GHVR01026706.1:41-1297(+)
MNLGDLGSGSLGSLWNTLDELSEKNPDVYEQFMNNMKEQYKTEELQSKGILPDACFCAESALFMSKAAQCMIQTSKDKPTFNSEEDSLESWYCDVVVNVCVSESIMSPIVVSSKKAATTTAELFDGELVFSLGARRELTIKGKKRVYWDVVVHPLVASLCKGDTLNERYRHAVLSYLLVSISSQETHKLEVEQRRAKLANAPVMPTVSIEAALEMKSSKPSKEDQPVLIRPRKAPAQVSKDKFKGATAVPRVVINPACVPGNEMRFLADREKSGMLFVKVLEMMGLREKCELKIASSNIGSSSNDSKKKRHTETLDCNVRVPSAFSIAKKNDDEIKETEQRTESKEKRNILIPGKSDGTEYIKPQQSRPTHSGMHAKSTGEDVMSALTGRTTGRTQAPRALWGRKPERPQMPLIQELD